MTTVSGRVHKLIDSESWVHAVDAPVVVLLNGEPIGRSTIDRNDEFSVEIPDDARGEIEVRVALNGAAPSFVTAEGNDLEVLVMYNPGNAYF